MVRATAGRVPAARWRHGPPEVWVLLLSKVRRGGHDYYLDVADDGTGGGIEPAGAWLGTGSAELGLSGVVRAGPFEAVLDGHHPETGVVLGGAHQRVRVQGFDVTLCAPKSVSVLHALGEPEVAAQVCAGHDRAVQATLSYLERHALAVRRRVALAPSSLSPTASVAGGSSAGAPADLRGDGVQLATGGARPAVRVPTPVRAVAAAGFVHRVSRALDPHLHTHVVVANLGRDEHGRWSALDGRGLYAHGAAAGALYQAQLRHELTARLGVAWGVLDRGRADVAGIGPEARREFSRRAAAIAEHLDGRGLTSRRARRVAGVVTRPNKERTLAAEDLREWWQGRARAVGLSATRLEAVLGRDRGNRLSEPNGGAEPDGAVRRAQVSAALAARGRPVRRRDVVRHWAGALGRGAPAADIEAAVDDTLGRWTAVGEGSAVQGRGRDVGVAERGYRVEEPELAVLLARRGIALDLSAGLGPDRGYGLG